jgi:hypothetical protein
MRATHISHRLFEKRRAGTNNSGGLVEQLDVTWFRGLKIWWSFTWRASVLFFIVVLPLEIVVLIFTKNSIPQQPGSTGRPDMATMAMLMMTAWPVLMAAVVALQAQAMRWMLRKAHWADLRVAILPRNE